MKELTGNARQKFEEYLNRLNHFGLRVVSKIEFSAYPLSMQIGVIEDFAESEGYYIEIWKGSMSEMWNIEINDNIMYNDEGDNIMFETKDEIRIEAIKRLNQLINSK